MAKTLFKNGFLNSNFVLLNVLLMCNTCNTAMQKLFGKILWQFASAPVCIAICLIINTFSLSKGIFACFLLNLIFVLSD